MNILRRFSVRSRLMLVCGVCIAGLLGLVAMTWTTLQRVKVGGPIYQTVVQDHGIIEDVVSPRMSLIEIYLNSHSVTDEDNGDQQAAHFAEGERLVAAYRERMIHWESTLPEGPVRTVLVGEAGAYARELIRLREDEVVPLARQGKRAEANRVLMNKLEPLFQKHTEALSRVAKLASEHAAASEREAMAATRWQLGVLLGQGAIAVLAAGLMIAVAGSITRPINALVSAVQRMAKGDLTVQVENGQTDELGRLATALNTSTASMRNLLGQVSAATEQVARASAEIAAGSEQMSGNLARQSLRTKQASIAVEEMSTSVVEVARKSTEAADASRESGRQAAGGGNVVQQTVGEIKAIAESVRQSAECVSALGAKSEQIGRIIAVINDIADQTNLLALNAAIEAARAGEHGRGFAVVADEVRKLAERTTQATDEVARSIRDIQAGTSEAVQQIKAGNDRVASGVRLAGDAGRALEAIVGSSQGLSSMVQSIAAAAEEQSSASAEIAKVIEGINQLTGESSAGAAQAADAAVELAHQASSLKELVGQFKV